MSKLALQTKMAKGTKRAVHVHQYFVRIAEDEVLTQVRCLQQRLEMRRECEAYNRPREDGHYEQTLR